MPILASQVSTIILWGLILLTPHAQASEPPQRRPTRNLVEEAQATPEAESDSMLFAAYTRDIVITGLMLAFGVKILKKLD